MVVYRILKPDLSERLPCVGVVCRYFWFTICSWDRRGREKKQRDSKFLACTLGTCKSSHYKKQVVVYGIWCCIFNKKSNFCLRFGEILYILYFTKLPSDWVVHAWVESRSLCFECTEMIFCLFLDNFWVFLTLLNCFNSASFRIQVISFNFVWSDDSETGVGSDLEYQLTLSGPRGADNARHITIGPPSFWTMQRLCDLLSFFCCYIW